MKTDNIRFPSPFKNRADFSRGRSALFFAATCNGNLERHEQGREEDDQHACRTHIADHNPVQSLGAEPLVLFDFAFNICSFYYISHQNTGHQCYNRHHQIVADKVEEVQHLLAEDGKVRPDAVAKDRQQTDQKGASGSDAACRNPFQMEPFFQHRNNGFHERNGRGERCQ